MNTTEQSAEDLAILNQLNNDYVHSDQFNDVKRFSEFLAEDFIVQLPGVTRNRAEFLEYIARPRPFKDLAVHDVNIRILSDVALIHGRSTYTTLADGVDQEALYTDTYQKREGTLRPPSAYAPARSRQITLVPGCSASQLANVSAARSWSTSTGRWVAMSTNTVP